MLFLPTDRSRLESDRETLFAAIRIVDTAPIRRFEIRRLMTQRPRTKG